jgi:hypothetical protein
LKAWDKARAAEAASKKAFELQFSRAGWRVAFFEGPTGAPRTGIIDAVAFRLARRNADLLEVRLVQLIDIAGPKQASRDGHWAWAWTPSITPRAMDGPAITERLGLTRFQTRPAKSPRADL